MKSDQLFQSAALFNLRFQLKSALAVLLLTGFYACSEKSSKTHCTLVDEESKLCSCSESKQISIGFKSDRLETCFLQEGNVMYSLFFYSGTDRIKLITVRSTQDDSYYDIYFKNNRTYIDKHNTELNEILSLRKNNFGGYNYDVYYYLPSLKLKTNAYSIYTDTLNQLLPDYCYYEYDKKKSSYKYISEALTENGIENDSLVFKYFEVDNLNDLNYYEYSNGTVGIKNKKNKKANFLVPKDLTFNQGRSTALVGELHVYFKSNRHQRDSINLLLIFQGDLQARLVEFNKGASKFNQKFSSNKITDKKKICKELAKFGVTFKNGKAYLSESLKSAIDNAETK